MLLCRSRCLQLLLLLVSTANSQYYNSEYDGDGNYEESGKADYSKYFASDTSAPLLQPTNPDADAKGFVQPLAFSSFFGTEGFGFGAASNQELVKAPKQPSGFVNPQEISAGFVDLKSAAPFGRDYFEDSQKIKEAASIVNPTYKDDYELKPGPSYISHKIVAPAPKASKPVKQTTKYGTEVNDLNRDYDKEYKEYKYKPVKEIVEKPDGGYVDGVDDKKISAPYSSFDFNKLPLPLQPYQQIVVDPKFLLPQSTASPYQKYSFQPSQLTDFASYNLQPSTAQIYEPSSSEVVAKLLKQKNCRKVNKEIKAAPGRTKRQAMDCYVCRDERSGANFEQCSYGAASTPNKYYVESSKKYSQPTQYESYRYKRYAEKEDEKEEDPYEYIKSQTQKYYSKPVDFEKEYLSAKGSDKEEYRFGPEYFTEDDEDKSSSEKQSEELVKHGENCKKVQKDGMICMVCKNKKGGNYEQCSYSSKPAEKKYAYVNEKKYDSDDDGAEETDGTEEKPVVKEQVFGQKYSKGEKGRKPEEVERIQTKSSNRKPKFDTYKKERIEVDTPLKSPHEDTYYYKHFPEYTKEESKKNEKTVEPDEYGYYGDGEKKEVEEVLAEFAKKDRSQCKKTEKNGMTCYLCTDKKGQQHEECMYVSESQPQSKYAAYHAAQESEDPKRDESKITPTEVPFAKTRRAPKKVEPVDSTTAASVAKQSKRILRRTKNLPASETTSEEHPIKKRGTRNVETYEASKTRNAKKFSETEPKTAATESQVKEAQEEKEKVDEYRTEGEEGAFSDETKPVFSKTLGFSVPKYMLIKSEGEKSYDEFVKRA